MGLDQLDLGMADHMCQGLEAPEPPRWFFSVSTGACVQQPPSLRNATFKILGYKVGTTLNCDCQRGFRRDPSSGPYMICRGNSSHSFWENKCQCMPTCKCRVYNCPPPEGKKNYSKEGGGFQLLLTQPCRQKSASPTYTITNACGSLSKYSTSVS